MTTPILMLVLLMAPYGVVRLLGSMKHREFDPRQAAALGLSLMFTFTAIGHFVETEAMSQMLPGWVPMRRSIIYLTGILS
jgi:uncharacterized membrane protein